jgi:AcrR family transcriptional regulator
VTADGHLGPQTRGERIAIAQLLVDPRSLYGPSPHDEICERADIASRTLFNHFGPRQDTVRTLAESRLVNLHSVAFATSDEPIPRRLVSVFDDIATTLVNSGETYREMIGEMLAAAAGGEVHTRHDPQIIADIIVGALSGAIENWRVDATYSLPTNLHNLGLALADLVVADGRGCGVLPPPSTR